MTKVKICGITNLEDALLSAKFGADSLGFNFYEKSPRYIKPQAAREIIDQLPDGVLKVGVFVNESLEKIIKTVKHARLDAIQLHGDETAEFVEEVKSATKLQIIKALRISNEFVSDDFLYFEAEAILLDTFSANEYGGTGETFEWEKAKKAMAIFPQVYLAGGLNEKNVGEAITQLRPYAVDACSGLELEKGIKDRAKVEAFITAVRNAI
ncbi:MAG: phosphoribosylanthranilate isomerase [Pyrinomonadaceae bacterium]